MVGMGIAVGDPAHVVVWETQHSLKAFGRGRLAVTMHHWHGRGRLVTECGETMHCSAAARRPPTAEMGAG